MMRMAFTALAFIALLLPARAQELAACGGADLFASLKARDSARLAKIEQEARAADNAQGLLWRIEKAGLPTSYLFGTMHVTDKRVLAQAVRLEPLLNQIKTLAVEVATPSGKGFEAPAVSILARATSPGLKTVSSITDAAIRGKLVEALKDRGISDKDAETFRPWYLAMLLSLPPCEMKRQATKLEVLDRKIEANAATKGVRIIGLETLDEQFSALASLPDDVVQAMIRQMATLGTVRDDIFETLIQSYLDGNVTKFMIASGKNGILGETDLTGMASFQTILIDRRNLVMRDRALPLLAKGEAFIAVGALHLPGLSGLVTLFRKAGYRLTPVW